MDIYQELRFRFPELVGAVESVSKDQVTIGLNATDPQPLASYLCSERGSRLAMVFGEDRTGVEGLYFNYYLFEQPAEPWYLLLQVPIDPRERQFPSLCADFPAVDWQEREIQDWLGLEAVGHPHPARIALQDQWPEVMPLRKSFVLHHDLPPFEGVSQFNQPAHGEGTFQIPVGPVHSGIAEPGQFDFTVAGEPILSLRLRLFYAHKGIEKLFEDLPVARAVTLAESISGDSAFSHGTAFCQAIERVAEIEVPLRGQVMRTILLELERIHNHIADIGAIAAEAGFGVAGAHACQLREMMLRLNESLTGSRLLRHFTCVGGVRRNWSLAQRDELRDTAREVELQFTKLAGLMESSNSTRDRLEHTGILTPEIARILGAVGVAARASGIDQDVRRDHPYAAYDRYPFRIPVYQAGDVLHRLQLRIDEVTESFSLLRAAAVDLAEGSFCAPPQPVPEGRCAVSAVEGWRGEIVQWVRTGAGGRLERCKIKDPSLNNWPALVKAVEGNAIADFSLILRSFNLSHSGTDR